MTEHTGGHSLRDDLERRIDEYRELLAGCVDDLTEEEASAIVAQGQPSLLGILRHVAFVEGVWFEEAVTGASRKEIGIPTATANSLKIRESDSIESIRAEYRRRNERSRELLAALDLEDTIDGRGERAVREVYLQVLSELAWRTGQTSILRQLVLDRRSSDGGDSLSG